MTRTCGPCAACCTVMGVVEFNKAVGQRCSKLCVETSGCSIYDERPKSCRDYTCVWLESEGHMRNMERPDIVGVLLDTDLESGRKGVLFARETRPGAFNEHGAAALLNRVAKRCAIILVNDPKRRIMGPKALVERVADIRSAK